MPMRFLLALFLVALASPSYADEKGIINIGDAIASYRLSAEYCNWPIAPRLSRVLSSDETHFSGKNQQAFNKGVKEGTERFYLLTHSNIDYCNEVKASRESMTQSLEERAK